jgi:Na+-translocating ferredoxin:NAD+ oxidoreductase RnfC subunit
MSSNMTDFSKIIKDAGIAGMGGAGFPAYMKVRNKADIVIANGAECEPLMKSDYYAISTYTKELIDGLNSLKAATGAKRAIIAVKAKRKEIIEKLRIFQKSGIEIALLDDYYPAGDEIVMISDILNIVVREGMLPIDEGIIVHNVATVIQMSKALKNDPMTRRFVTVTGDVRKPFSAEVPLGISFKDLIEVAEGTELSEYAIMENGVMMGGVVSTDDVVKKTTAGIIILPMNHPAVLDRSSNIDRQYKIARSVCDQCYACSEVCPRLLIGHRIEPHKIMRSVAFPMEQSAQAAALAANCCLCGLCSLFACPLGISPRRVIEAVKKTSSVHVEPAGFRAVDPMIAMKRVPMSRLLFRLGLDKYDRKEIVFLKEYHEVKLVRLMLLQHRGTPSLPVVKEGDIVKKGDLVAKAAEKDPSLPVHSSMSGKVTAVNKEYIEVKCG